METGPTIAVVEDDADIRAQLADYLAQEGFRAVALSGGAGLDRLMSTGPVPDLVVLDWMLPGEDGLSICRRLREGSGPPVVMLTAKDGDIDRVLGLEMAADDYVSTPFNSRVLLARIRAVLRRAEGAGQRTAPAMTKRLGVLDLVIDTAGRRVLFGDSATDIPLTSAEYDLLHCFITHPQRVLSRDQLLDWTRGHTADAFDRTIDVQVSRLRHKLDACCSAAAALIKPMKSFTAAALGAVVLAIGLSASTMPAAALGACGPNGHRNLWGRCVWGGQHQAWCARHTGHAAGYGAYGTRWCR